MFEMVGRAAGAGPNVVSRGAPVDGAWDLVDVEQLASFWISLANDIDSERFHHRNGHVDAQLRNDSLPVSSKVIDSEAWGAQRRTDGMYWLEMLAANRIQEPLRPAGAVERGRHPGDSR